MRKIFSFIVLVLLAVSSAAYADNKIVVYTSQLEQDAHQTVEAFKKANPGIEVEWTRSGTTSLMNKLRAEFAAGNPRPDVILIADMVTMESLKKQGRLLPYKEAPVKGYDENLYDKDGCYFSTKVISTGIVYNNKAPFVPESIKDLERPEAKNLVIMPSPLYSGAAAIHMHTLVQNPDLGWDVYKKLASNGAVTSKGNGGSYKAVASGEKLYGFVIDYLPIRNMAKGAPVNFIIPKEGASAVTEPVAILSTSKNPEGAKKFVDFMLSEQGQNLASSQGFMPAMNGISAPAGFPDKIKLMPLDTSEALRKDRKYKREFSEIFGG
ncbi:ABC transporter substrate-binding protein [Maridesulfovibrio bastinii]|uniref:ABC transporter substrate-binding protein n=1 Tax=Maridesulfovibrio bastinii TaxID=47157 RepID=UPI0004190154|nr:ABC transporter substrate-binding protein [Maridesulfovibrio bastinii]